MDVLKYLRLGTTEGGNLHLKELIISIICACMLIAFYWSVPAFSEEKKKADNGGLGNRHPIPEKNTDPFTGNLFKQNKIFDFGFDS